MAKTASIPTRVSADLAASAASVAPAEFRTVTEQINYWARIGMQVERSGSLAAAGEAQFSTLSAEERTAAHAIIDAQIAEQVAQQRFGSAARTAGQVTVSLDVDGQLVEIAPGGRRRRL
jgi:hypothetical protein